MAPTNGDETLRSPAGGRVEAGRLASARAGGRVEPGQRPVLAKRAARGAGSRRTAAMSSL